MFDGTIGDWDTEPVNLDLNYDYKQFNCKYYLVARINKETFRKELEKLSKIRVLTPVQWSQYITPVFIIPYKEENVGFITDYHRINQKISRKPYPLPRIGKKMLQMEGFQDAT